MNYQDNFNLDKNQATLKNTAMTRIQHDLISPSANIRSRAIKALNSPSIIYYNNFDVAHQIEDINFNDDKRIHHSHQKPIDIKEVMNNVIIYVEVRTGEDDHSAGIKNVISQLGAKVNNRLLRNTTHVVFKDGLQSTYNKAKNWQIPIVSVLWIEACKKHIKLIDSNLYPISNRDRYENPELYDKIKKVKYMQPDSEENHNRIKTASMKNNNTPKNNQIRSSVRMPRKPRDSLNDIFHEFQEKLLAAADDDDEDFVPFQSKLLDRIRNSPSIQSKLSELDEKSIDDKTDENKYEKIDFKSVKTLKFNAKDKKISDIENNSTQKSLNRRKSIHVVDKMKKQQINAPEFSTPQRKISRKSCIGFGVSATIPNKTKNLPSKKQIELKNENLQKKIFNYFPKHNELSLYDDRNLNISEKKENIIPGTPEVYSKKLYNSSKFIEFKNTKISELEDYKTFNGPNQQFSTPTNSKSSNNKDELLNTIVEDVFVFNSIKKPINRRKTIFESSMDIIDRSLHNINKLSKLNKSLIDENKIDNSSPYNKHFSPADTLKTFNSLNITSNVVATPKKRKLFVPDQMISVTPTGKEIIDNSKLKSLGSGKRINDDSLQSKLKVKQRRTINVCTSVNTIPQKSGKN